MAGLQLQIISKNIGKPEIHEVSEPYMYRSH